MAKLSNLARMTTATTGAGTITLGVAVTGYLTFALAGVADGDTVSYGISDGSGGEVGTGVYTASGTTLSRTPTASTNGNAAISLSGTAQVFVTARAEDLNDASRFTAGTLPLARRGYTMPDVIVEDQEASGTGGGASTSGSWFTRTLNTLARNIGSIASLSTNQVTLGAGTYYAAWSAPHGPSDGHQTRLFNVTDSAVVGYGTSEYINSAASFAISRSFGSVVFTIAGSKAFRVEMRVVTSNANAAALGPSNAFGNINTFSRLEITQLA